MTSGECFYKTEQGSNRQLLAVIFYRDISFSFSLLGEEACLSNANNLKVFLTLRDLFSTESFLDKYLVERDGSSLYCTHIRQEPGLSPEGATACFDSTFIRGTQVLYQNNM